MKAMQVMSALSQWARLETFRRLVDALPDAMAAGDIAAAVGTTPNTMSAHLAVLSRAGLVASQKQGRTVLYTAETGPAEELSEFLLQACERGKRARMTAGDK
jgi:DNA-binding transcriptional ArsR family regulator